jgi:hypothetical protein
MIFRNLAGLLNLDFPAIDRIMFSLLKVILSHDTVPGQRTVSVREEIRHVLVGVVV